MIRKRDKSAGSASEPNPAADGQESASASVFGVGAQVIVRLDRSAYPDSTMQDPSAVIVASGDLTGGGLFAPTSIRDAVWVVEFDEPFYALDGSGPFETARVASSSLSAAPEWLAP